MAKIREYKQEKNNLVCKKCSTDFVFKPDECKFYEFGTYSAKTIVCPKCGCTNTIKWIEASGLDVNNDERYYQ